MAKKFYSFCQKSILLSIKIDNSFTLEIKENYHLIRVLRVKINDIIIVFNGKGLSFNCRITKIKNNELILKVLYINKLSKNFPYIKLVQSLPKAKAMNQVIKYSVELGVDEIIPVSTRYAEIKIKPEEEEKKIKKWRSISIESCKQSGNLFLPIIRNIRTLENCLTSLDKKPNNQIKIIASLRSANLQLVEYLKYKTIVKSCNEIVLCIGPEGGFTIHEENYAIQLGFFPVRLGKNILRIETAVVYILSVIDAYFK